MIILKWFLSHVADTSLLIANAINDNKTILFEGAQGDIIRY